MHLLVQPTQKIRAGKLFYYFGGIICSILVVNFENESKLNNFILEAMSSITLALTDLFF